MSEPTRRSRSRPLIAQWVNDSPKSNVQISFFQGGGGDLHRTQHRGTLKQGEADSLDGARWSTTYAMATTELSMLCATIGLLQGLTPK
jgi:hypothetical protein